jgi:hypothetical protein
VAAVAFVYYGSTRVVNERQAVFLADALDRRALFSPAAGQLAQRIRRETGGDGEKKSVRIELDEEDKEDLLVVLGDAHLDKHLDRELRDLQRMLRGERWSGEPEPPTA